MSEKINIQNYEAFFLDYIEGNLHSSKIKELKRFLELHPELKEELENFEMLTLTPENIYYTKKEELTVNTQAKYFDISDTEYLCIAQAEKDISLKESEQLNVKIKHDNTILTDLKLYKQARLSADESIVFKKKNELLKKRTPVNLRIISLAAAAVFAGILVLNVSGLLKSNDSNIRYGNQIHSELSENHIAPKINHQIENTEENGVQGALISHNQTNNQTIKDDLMFADNEPRENNLYKELTVLIPDIKSEALIFSETKSDLDYALAYNPSDNINDKETVWDYAEKGVNLWKLISSSELEMNNRYFADGTIEKLNISHPNLKFSRTFYKNKE